MNRSSARRQTLHRLPVTPTPALNQPASALDRLRAQSLALTGGRTPGAFAQEVPLSAGLQGRNKDFHREVEIRAKTNQKRPIAIVPDKCPARDACGPPIDTNLTQLTSDGSGKLDTSMWMHDWFGHSCGCGEET